MVKTIAAPTQKIVLTIPVTGSRRGCPCTLSSGVNISVTNALMLLMVVLL